MEFNGEISMLPYVLNFDSFIFIPHTVRLRKKEKVELAEISRSLIEIFDKRCLEDNSRQDCCPNSIPVT